MIRSGFTFHWPATLGHAVINSVLSVVRKVALKRQQAAEDAIALKMAKVATGQKLNRLPPGKIFGMSVTEPKSVVENNGEEDEERTEEAIIEVVEPKKDQRHDPQVLMTSKQI